MKTISSLFLLVLCLASFSSAQTKKLTLKQAILEARTTLAPDTLDQLRWRPSSAQFCYTDSSEGFWILWGESVSETQRHVLLRLDSLNSMLQKAGCDKTEKFPPITWIERDIFQFWSANKLVSCRLDSPSVSVINETQEGAQNSDVNDKTGHIAYTRENDLFIAYPNGEHKQVTYSGDSDIHYGLMVYRNEFGVKKGTFWSPGGKFLAFYEKDERLVTDYPLVDIDIRPAEERAIKYPMAGMASERVRVGIYDLTTGSTTWLQTGEPRDHYLTNLTWSPDEKSIYVVHLNRDQNHVRVIKYDPVSGEPLITLFEEKDPRYITLESDPQFIDNNSNRFLWFSRRDGHRHLYLYDSDGKMIKKLTRGEWDITALETAEKSEDVFITTTAKSPLERHAYRLNVSSGRLYPLTGKRGDHRIDANDSGEYILDKFSSVTVPRQTEILDNHGRSVKKVQHAENPLKDFFLGEIKIDSLTTGEGTKLYSRMFLPPEFHSDAKYPVIVYVYNGPHIQLIRNSWLAGGRLWFHYMAQKGYIVYTVDGRGSAFRGAEFEKIIFRELGTVEIEDQLKGIDYLKSLAFVDSTRIGVFGWSYGGYMSASLMTRVPGIFKVGVAGAPVIDWRYYEVMYTERFMDTPESNPQGYIKSSVLEYIDQLDGRLLLIHGTADPVVVWQHTLLFLDRAIDEEKQVDYFVYPGHKHGITGKDSYHLYRKITDYFDLHL